jgi:hypothetical protein
VVSYPLQHVSVINIFSGGLSNSVVLFSTQEEANAIHADKVFAESGVKGRIIIKSPDTEVLVLYVHYFSKLQHTQELWFQTIFPLESYSFITSLRAAVTDTSTSQSARFDRSLKLSGFSFRTLKTAEDENLNKLRTRLATVKSACFAKFAPCEATFKQHVLKASLQTYVWYHAILESPFT